MESFSDKLKRWFQLGGASAATPDSNVIKLTDELKAGLSSSSPLARRLHVIEGLAERLKTSKLETNGIEQVWCLAEDLLDVLQVPPPCRHATLRMFTLYAAGEPNLAYMRMVFIKQIKWSYPQEDPEPLFKFFRAVVGGGRQVQYVEEEVALLLARWLPMLLASVTNEALQMTINIIKFNSAFLDNPVITTYVREAMHKMLGARNEEEAVLCLTLLETVTAYRYLPVEAITIALTGLCRIVNVPRLTVRVVKVARNILGTWVGPAAYDMLLAMMHKGEDVQLVRSAMFFASYVTWGEGQIPTLNARQHELLKAMYECLSDTCDMRWEKLVLYEVALSLLRLLGDVKQSLDARLWNLVIDIVIPLYTHTERVEEAGPRGKILVVLKDVMNRLEFFVDLNLYRGNIDKFYVLLDYVRHHRPQISTFKIINHWKKSVTPPQLDWIENLIILVRRYFVLDPRPFVKLKMLDLVKEVYERHKGRHGHVILEAVVAELFVGFERLTSVEVRTEVVRFLVTLGVGQRSNTVEEVPKLMREVIMIKYRQKTPQEQTPEETLDVIAAVKGLVRLFREKTWQCPSKISVTTYRILMAFLETHYKRPDILGKVNETRLEVFQIMFSMKCDDRNHLGFSSGEPSAIEERNKGIISPYSPYVVVSHNAEESEEAGGPADDDVSVVPLAHLGKILLLALQTEKDWEVLEYLLRELAQKLHHKTIVLSFMGERMDSLTYLLCKMACDMSLNFPSCLSNTPDKLSRSEFESHLYPVLAVLTAHCRLISPFTKQQLISSLQQGVINRYCGQLCIEAITLCVVEMPQAMGKLITRVIDQFTKITQSVSRSQAMLEFLSTLLHFPSMYQSFVLPQYMSIFAIAIPYTDPFKFNHYIMSLAFHVIAMWFIKCNVAFRKNVVKYVTNNLNLKLEYLTKTLKPKGTLEKKGKKSRKEKAKEKEGLEEEERNKKFMLFTDLMDTCIDLMSRYTFAFFKPVVKRSGVAKMLVEEGKSQTWIAGNKLITVTTSGCAGKVGQAGLCDLCHNLCGPGVPDVKKVNLEQTSSHDETDVSSSKVIGHGITLHTSPEASQPSPVSPSRTTSTLPSTPPFTHESHYTNQPLLSPPSTQPPSSFPFPPTQSSPSASTKASQSSPPAEPSFSSPSCSTRCRSAPSSPKPMCSPSSQSMQHKVSPKSLPSQTPPCTKPSPSTPSTPQSPSFPFAKYPEYSPLQTSPDISHVLPLAFESSQDVSRECSPDKQVLQRTPSPQASSKEEQNERLLLSKDNLNLPLANLKRTDEIDGKRQSWARDCHDGLPSPPLPSVPEDTGASGQLLGEAAAPAPAGPRPRLCACWCRHWAELHLRQPCGNFSALMRFESEQFMDTDSSFPLQELSEIICPSKTKDDKNAMEQRKTIPGTSDISGDSCVEAAAQGEDVKQVSEASVSPSPQKTVSPSSQKTVSPSPQKTVSPSPQKTVSPSPQKTVSPSPQKTVSPSPQKSESPSPQKTAASAQKGASPKKNYNRMADEKSNLKEEMSGGMSPSFVFLQLYWYRMMPTDDSRPILLPTDQRETQRSIWLLDLIKCYDTHKIGVVYMRCGQTTEQEILSNTCGSARYIQFLWALGSYVKVAKVSENVFLGGLDTKGVDGDEALVWNDDLMQVAFHVATMMPTKVSDPKCNDKKRHIGNNYVTVVFNESGHPYNINTIKGQFNHIVIEIVPNNEDTNTVRLHYQPELLKYLRNGGPRFVSNKSLAIFIRQTAVHCDLAAKIMESLQRPPHKPYANNWVERLRHIRRIHSTVLGNIKKSEEKYGAPQLNDFTDLVDVTVRNVELSKFGQYSIQLIHS